MLEDAKAQLAMMLTSKYIKPLRDEAASWALKLTDIGEVLDQVGPVFLVTRNTCIRSSLALFRR